MNRFPPLAWILGFFVFGAISIFIYAGTGPETLPTPVSVWSHVEGFRTDIQYRNERIPEGQEVEKSEPPYKIRVRRLTNLTRSRDLARYLVHFRLDGSIRKEGTWLEEGFDVALIDTKPNEPVGDVRIVTTRKYKRGKG